MFRKPKAVLVLINLILPALLAACMPATGPYSMTVTPTQAEGWTPAALLRRGEVPRDLLRPLPDAVQEAPLGSIIIACQSHGAVWGLCTHMTRKISADQLAEIPGPFRKGAGFLPTRVLLEREMIIVLDVGVRPEHLARLRAAAETLRGKPYSIGGQGPFYDCVTYQNALQRAVGLPEVARQNPDWQAFLPIGALNMPGNRVLMVGVKKYPGLAQADLSPVPVQGTP